MDARRLDRTVVFLGIVSTLTFGASAEAQLSDGQWRLLQANTGKMGVEVKHQPTVFAHPGLHSSLFRQPVAFSLVPTVLMSDGTVFANFGRGFQPVQRSCGGVVVGQPRVIGSNGFVLREAAPPTYTQPVPAQMTSSQQMLPSVQAQSGRGRRELQNHLAADVACFSRDASGRVFTHRF